MNKKLVMIIVTLFFCQGLCIAEKHCFDTFYKVKVDNGYCIPEQTSKTDIHDGWKLGEFVLSGYTSKKQIGNTFVFLKNVGDRIELNFNLLQDIDDVKGDGKIVVEKDLKGYDKIFNIEKSDFGRGMLIIRHVNYEGTKKIVPYKDFLSGKSRSAVTNIQMLEEGDYDVALDYKLRDKVNYILPDDFTDYKMSCSFKVRNSNCMVFLFDVDNGMREIRNGATVLNGFRLDLAKSRYLDINIERVVLVSDKNGRYVEDVRENKAAKDGAIYSEEGIYVVEVSNPVTQRKTTKKIYVGSNKVLTAYVKPENSAFSIEDIATYVERGATIDSYGKIDFSKINGGKVTGAKIRTACNLGWKLLKDGVVVAKRIIAGDDEDDLKPKLKEMFEVFKALCWLYGAEDITELKK